MCCGNKSRCGGSYTKRGSRLATLYQAYKSHRDQQAMAQQAPVQYLTGKERAPAVVDQQPPSYDTAIERGRLMSTEKSASPSWSPTKAQSPVRNEKHATAAEEEFERFEVAIMDEARQFIERYRPREQRA